MTEEMPSGTASRTATILNMDTTTSSRTQLYNEQGYDHDSKHPASTSRPRGNSNVSRVDLHFFDPDGVGELQRTLTKQAEQEKFERAHTHTEPVHDPEQGRLSIQSSDETLNDQPFDFQKTLDRFVRMFVFLILFLVFYQCTSLSSRREEHNIKPRSLGIVFRDLRVSGLTAASPYFPTLGSMFNPMSMLENVQSLRHPNIKDILSGFEGVAKPGEMIRMFIRFTWCSDSLNFCQVVLGSPGSGCTTLLKTLSNQTKEYHSVNGDIHYDSLSPEELNKYFRGDVQYCPEDDVHFPTLTVQQTIGFAAAARTPRGGAFDSPKTCADNVTTTLSTVFGLNHALNTPIGDAAIQGVSGGEKKRVSIAEALTSRACIGAWDKYAVYIFLSRHPILIPFLVQPVVSIPVLR